MPPAPIRDWISYGPSLVPEVSAIGRDYTRAAERVKKRRITMVGSGRKNINHEGHEVTRRKTTSESSLRDYFASFVVDASCVHRQTSGIATRALQNDSSL